MLNILYISFFYTYLRRSKITTQTKLNETFKHSYCGIYDKVKFCSGLNINGSKPGFYSINLSETSKIPHPTK